MDAKLAVGADSDPLEREATDIAEQAMSRPDGQPPVTRSAPRGSAHAAQAQPSRKGSPQALATAPAAVHRALRSAGQPLDKGTRAVLEPRLDRDFSDVRVHTGALADESARSIDALAFTVGNEIVFRAGQYAPHKAPGRKLLAHELAHVGQQTRRDGAGSPNKHGNRSPGAVIQRVPAAPAPAKYDRSAISISPIPDFYASKAGQTWIGVYASTVSVSNPSVQHLTWELYDPADQMVDGFSTIPGSATSLNAPFTVDLNRFSNRVVQGRYTLRCVGLGATHQPVVYADNSFFIWTTHPGSMQDLATLNAVKKAPASHSLGEVGAADARAMMLEHRASLAAGGSGTVQGNRSGVTPAAGVTQLDCTTYVLAVLKDAFTAKGKGADWAKVMAVANKGSGGALKGTEVLKALESEAGWKAVFWSPDPRNPDDSKPEHPKAYKDVKKTGKYYGVDVDSKKSIVEYRRTSPTREETWSQLDKLKKVPLGVIAARGGTHMTLILNGEVYEVHWDKPPSDPNVIEATPLERWAWNSGVIVMPAADFAAAF